MKCQTIWGAGDTARQWIKSSQIFFSNVDRLTRWRYKSKQKLPEDGERVHEVVHRAWRGGLAGASLAVLLVATPVTADGKSFRELFLPRTGTCGHNVTLLIHRISLTSTI